MQKENLPSSPYTYDHIKMLWRRFAYEMKEKGMETFYNALIKKEPILKEEHSFLLEVDNQIQIDYISVHLQDLINYLRKESDNYHIVVEIKLGTPQEEDIKFLTGKDKFAAMARKNPNLHSFKNTFNLDIEY